MRFKKIMIRIQELECALKWDCYKLCFNTKLICLIWDFSNVFLLLFMIDLMDMLLNSWKGEITKPCLSQTLLHQCLISSFFKQSFNSCHLLYGEQY